MAFFENCFKHGASKFLEHPWINLTIDISDSVLELKLMNGKVPVGKPSQNAGIGIDNVRKRLSLLYENKHELKIIEEEDVFVVNLILELVCKNFDYDPLGDFITCDFFAGYKLNKLLHITVGITNLFNSKQIEFVGSPSISRFASIELKMFILNKKR